MADTPPIDPVALFRAFFAVPGGEPARSTPGAVTDDPTARMMAQALAAANMPSRGEVEEIAIRLDRIEETLGRIERTLADAPRRKKRKA